MARTLSSELYTALDRDQHEPYIKLLSSDIEASIPFDGNAFNFSNEDTWKPYMVSHTNGNIYTVMIDSQGGDSTLDLPTVVIADTSTDELSKLQPSGLNTGVGSNQSIDRIAIVEKSDGNLGVIMARHGASDTTGSIYSATIDTDGAVVTTPTQIGTYPRATDGSYGLTGLSITLLASGTYYLVYCYTISGSPGFYIYKLTSSDWSSWAGPTAISHGLDTDTTKVSDVFIFQASDNDVFLLFSYTDTVSGTLEIYNIYSMLSTNSGSTWGSAEARTTYTDAGSSAYTPVLVQKDDGTLYMVFYQRSNVLRITDDDLGWQDSDFYACPYGFTPRSIAYNDSTGHLTCSYGRSAAITGTKCLCGVLVIDIASWQIIDNFNEYSTPAMNGLFADNTIPEHCMEYAAGSKFVVMHESTWGQGAIMLLDVESGSIDHIVIAPTGEDPYTAYGLSKTITLDIADYPDFSHSIEPTFVGITLNEPNVDTIYILSLKTGVGTKGYWILKIPLDDLDNLTFVGSRYATDWEEEERLNLKYIDVYDTQGRILVAAGHNIFKGAVVLHNKSTGAVISEYTTSTTTNFPYHGSYYCRPAYHNDHVYFNFKYSSEAGYENQRGMCDIDTTTGTISTIRPSWNSEDGYGLYGKAIVDATNNCLWMTPWESAQSTSPGAYVVVTKYDISLGTWTIYTSYTMPGIPEAGFAVGLGQTIAIDSDTGNIIVGLGRTISAESNSPGVMMFNADGDFKQVKYLNAEKSGSWAWETQDDIADFVLSLTSSNPAVAVDPNNVIWAMWDDYSFTTNVNTPYWDRDLGETNIAGYLVGTVTAKWEIKRPGRLSFSLSHGHLFDPQNTYSLLRDIVKKSRKLSLYLGENYNGTAYSEAQGSYIVIETRLEYDRGRYPIIRVKAESMSGIFKEQNIISTSLYSTTPAAMITDILATHAQLYAGDYSVPTFDSAHDVEYQFMDVSVWDAIEQIADHWLYFPYDDMDGVFTFIKFNLDKNADHIYSDNKKLVGFTPDDTYSDFTNSVRVVGESDDLVDVTYPEELVGSLAGTIGWWENTQTRTVSFSSDKASDRLCINPRLDIIQSISYQGPLVDAISTSEGGESISYEDPNYRYIEITINVPNLTHAVVLAVASMLGLGIQAIGCDGSISGLCGALIFALTIDIAAVFYILMAMANYQYDVYAQPIGEEKQTIEYTANDTIHQQSFGGRVVRQDIEDPFCGTVAECIRVADANLAIVKAQRDRIKFRKVANMQDEIGDKIRVVHPYSAETMEIFITAITRTYRKGTGESSGMFDEIEGWRTT